MQQFKIEYLDKADTLATKHVNAESAREAQASFEHEHPDFSVVDVQPVIEREDDTQD